MNTDPVAYEHRLHTMNTDIRGETALNLLAQVSPGSDKAPYIEDIAEVAELLIQAGADLEWNGRSELSPITEAILSANHVLVRQLLQANCSGKFPWLLTTLWRSAKDRDRKLSAFMQAAVKSNAKDCASFVLGDVCCLEKPKTPGLSKHKKELQQLFYDLSLNPEAWVNGETIGLCPPPVPTPTPQAVSGYRTVPTPCPTPTPQAVSGCRTVPAPCPTPTPQAVSGYRTVPTPCPHSHSSGCVGL